MSWAVVSRGSCQGVSRGQGRWCALPGMWAGGLSGRSHPCEAPACLVGSVHRAVAPPGKSPPAKQLPCDVPPGDPPDAGARAWCGGMWAGPRPQRLPRSVAVWPRGGVGGLGTCRGPAWPGGKARARGRGRHGRHPPAYSSRRRRASGGGERERWRRAASGR